MDAFSHLDANSHFEDDEDFRDLGAFEDVCMIRDEDDDTFDCFNDEQAVYRGLAMEEAFSENLLSAESPLVPGTKTSHHLPSSTAASRTDEGAPALTDGWGFVSRTRLFSSGCGDGHAFHILQAVKRCCQGKDCSVESMGDYKIELSHFSRKHLSLRFEVRAWRVQSKSHVKKVLPDCPSEATHVLEFTKLSGCSFKWRELFSSIGNTLLQTDTCFFGDVPVPPPDFSAMELSDTEEDTVEEGPSDMDNFVHMLKAGTVESQLAAMSAVLQYCVSKQACDQLVTSGFLQVAHAVMAQTHQNETLLRCILVAMSSVVAHSEEGRTAVSQNSDVCDSLRNCSPQYFTRECEPLVRLISAS